MLKHMFKWFKLLATVIQLVRIFMKLVDWVWGLFLVAYSTSHTGAPS